MANLTETPTYEAGIYQLETTDPVLGGPTGITNTPARQLANRTAWLKQAVDALNAAAPGTATQAWVAEQLQGMDWKASVRVATTANISLSGTQTIDGVAVVAGDRVLVKNQSSGAANGIYVVAAGAWSRADDANTSAKVTPMMIVPVEAGTAGADRLFRLTTDAPITLGSTVLTFADLLAGYATTASPTLTGVPTAPTAGVDTQTTQIATTAFVINQCGTTPPAMDGVANSGTSLRYARQDHVHPTDTSRAPATHVGSTGSAHGNASTVVAGFMSAADKTKLDGVATGAAAVGSSVALALAASAAAGTASTAARSDHVHPLPSLDMLSNVLITANVNGEILRWNGTHWVNNTIAEAGIAPSSHVGATGSAHGNATTSVAGFMSAADKTKLDGVATGAAAVGNVTAFPLGLASAGTSSTAARSDHVHQRPDLGGLNDVFISSAANGEILRWNGANWVNNTLDEAGIAPVNSPTFTGAPTAPHANHNSDGTSQIATSLFVQNLGVAFGSVVVKTSSATISEPEFGRVINCAGASSFTLTIPLANSIRAGRKILIMNTAGVSFVTVARSGTNTFKVGNTNQTSLTLGSGDYVELVSDGSGSYYVTGTVALYQSSQFQALIGQNGYQKLPSGLTIQWGRVASVGIDSNQAVTLPTAFYVASYSVTLTARGTAVSGGAAAYSLGVANETTSGFTIYNDGANAVGVNWVAIGY